MGAIGKCCAALSVGFLVALTSNAASAAKQSAYTPAPGSKGAVVCTYNANDTVYLVPYAAAWVPEGAMAVLGCRDSKKNFCRVRGEGGVSFEGFKTLLLERRIVDAISGTGMMSAPVKALTYESDAAKAVCKPMVGIIQTLPYLGEVHYGKLATLGPGSKLTISDFPVKPEVIAASLGPRLYAGQTMHPGDLLLSGNQQIRLKFQEDGNLVIYKGPLVLWATHTEGSGADRVRMQEDGNFVVSAGPKAVWATGTEGTSADHVTIGNDGRLVVYTGDGSGGVWRTESCCYD